MEIECKYKNMIWPRLGSLYNGIITAASITEPNQEIRTFIGKHEAGKTDCDVEAIYFQNTNVHYMPRGISKFFPNLKAVWILNCGLKEITREDLFGLENIEVLSLRNNDLTSLPDDLFEGMKKLKVISFTHNKLEFVSSQLLQPVLGNHLTGVSFFKNTKIDAAFEKNLEPPFISLQDLLKLIDESFKKPSNQLKNKFSTNFMKELEDLWTSGFLSDFTIIVGDRKFQVHKTILAMHSKFFKEMFKSDATSITELRNQDFSAETVEKVLRWMYTRINPDTKNAVENFSLCTKLEISDLKEFAENLVLENVNEDNAMEIFKLGSQHSSEKFKTSAFEEIKKFLADPDLEDEMIEDVEKLEKLVEIKKIYNEAKKGCKKRKLN